jgi:hypothetical protein
MELWAQESALESWTQESARDEDVDSIEAIVEKGVDAKMILLKTPYARSHTGVAKSRDTSGKKARDGVASTEHA